MARTTGPLLAIGAVSMANQALTPGASVDWRIPVAAGLGAGVFALAERAWPDGVVAIAWLALLATLFVRPSPAVPAPIETLTNTLRTKG